MTAWFAISCILLVIWTIAFLVGNGAFIYSHFEYNDVAKEDYQLFAASMAASLVFVFFHWILLLLVVPVFLMYGLGQAIKLLKTKPWKKA